MNQCHEKMVSILKYGFLSYCKQGRGLKTSVGNLYPKSSEGTLEVPF